ncbi:MAG: DUF4012 domain-containing protein, partial [Candidatus Parcubacteria bacterium]|nr:DUF4012 domain-containing protein [Candidatus Parcubacteria bacterium]
MEQYKAPRQPANINLPSPDYTQIKEKPRKSLAKVIIWGIVKILALILVLILIFAAALGLIYYNNIKQAYGLSFSAKADLEDAAHQIINRDFKTAVDYIKNANSKFIQAQNYLNQVVIVRRIPYIGLQLKAVDNVLVAGIKLTDSGQQVVLLIDEITAPLKNESITYASLSVEQKRQILEKIVASESMLLDVQKQIDEADTAISAIPSEKLVKPLRDGIAPIQENLPRMKLLIDNALPLLRLVPKIAAFDQPKSYLFLLQNNSELRPTGGFIGTYGIVKLQDGDIKEFATDNIYNLDRSTQKLVAEPSPWPILGELLNLTGPIVTDNMLFTSENYQDQLELMVGKMYQELDIPVSQRKEIIRKLADQIKLKLTTLPLQKLPEIIDMGFNAMDQKQIQIYVKDADLEKLILERGWGGEIKQTEGDYLMVVDSNLASLKTDQYVKRKIDYSLYWQGNDLIGKTVITYQNDADFTWKSTRLRSYTRVYVPLGSELISSKGAMENDKIKDPQKQVGQVEASSEFGKTYFGAFISIEPHEQGVLSFEYKLPQRIKDLIKINNSYNLSVQKQAGVLPYLTLDLKFGKNIKSAVPAEPENEWFNNSYNNNLALDKDKYISVN